MIDNVKENGAYIVISPEFALPHEGFDRGCNEVGMNLIRLKEPVMIEDIDGEITEVRFFCCMSTEDHKKHMKAFFHSDQYADKPRVQRRTCSGKDIRRGSRHHKKVRDAY